MEPVAIESCRRRRAFDRPDEHVDSVQAASVYEGSDRTGANVVQAPAFEGETLRTEIGDRRGERNLAIEPRLDGVAVCRYDIEFASGERALVR